jgi:hypothetical protein
VGRQLTREAPLTLPFRVIENQLRGTATQPLILVLIQRNRGETVADVEKNIIGYRSTTHAPGKLIPPLETNAHLGCTQSLYHYLPPRRSHVKM